MVEYLPCLLEALEPSPARLTKEKGGEEEDSSDDGDAMMMMMMTTLRLLGL